MSFKRFKDIIAWQKAQDFAVELYEIFNKSKDYGFKDQILKAVVSISNNIAEGYDRSSTKEFNRFLFIASGSCSETRSMLYLASKLKYIDLTKRDNLIEKSNEISKIISGLRKSLNLKSNP
ncbi:MAG: four helix bundle protein [Saprospiraceae bacterium]|nr:four helix bundle protein [Saprospiraceae bacterium]